MASGTQFDQLKQIIESQNLVIDSLKGQLAGIQHSLVICEENIEDQHKDVANIVKTTCETEFKTLIEKNVNDIADLVRADLGEGNYSRKSELQYIFGVSIVTINSTLGIN